MDYPAWEFNGFAWDTTAPAEADTVRGYRVSDSKAGISGLALLSGRNAGKELLIRLKDTRPALEGEIAFWGQQLAEAVSADSHFDYIGFPPSSGKRPEDEYLARKLAAAAAAARRTPLVEAFVNPTPRKTRARLVAKLQEQTAYEFVGPPGDYLIVDDAVYTRSTARRCVEAAGADARLFFVFLYGN